MVTNAVNDIQSEKENWQESEDFQAVECSIGIMAHNEEANIARAIHAILDQKGSSFHIAEIIVVASGCTDRTVPIVTDIALQEPRVRLCIQEKREGKASAINLFLKKASSTIVVLVGADIIPEHSAIQHLCIHFKNPKIGMVGGRPVPVNDSSTFMGYAAHLLWRLHDHLARTHPKLGEVIAFRNVISGIPTSSAVDEISIQALISQLGYELIYEPACIVYNKGALTIHDFLKQRRRIYAGHLKVREQQQYEASTMKVSTLFQQLFACRDFILSSRKQVLWTVGAVALEAFARLQGYYDHCCKREHHIWQMVDSTKSLEIGQYKVRHISNAQSVLVFRLFFEGIETYDANPEREVREVTEIARKLVTTLHTKLRKEDEVSINGLGIITVVIRAEQSGAEIVAKRIQEIIQAKPVRSGWRGREFNVKVAYSSLTFASRQKNGTMTVHGPLMDASMAAITGMNAE